MAKADTTPFRCPHCAGPLSKDLETSSWTVGPLIRDSFSMIGTAVGGTASAFYGFNHVMPVVRRWVKGPMWLHFLVGIRCTWMLVELDQALKTKICFRLSYIINYSLLRISSSACDSILFCLCWTCRRRLASCGAVGVLVMPCSDLIQICWCSHVIIFSRQQFAQISKLISPVIGCCLHCDP